MKPEIREIIDNLDAQKLIDFYKTHSIGDTEKQFKLSRYYIHQILEQHNIPKHTYQENVLLNNNNHGNNYANKMKNIFNEFINSLNIDEFYNYYLTNGLEYTSNKYEISKGQVNKVLDYYSLKHLTPNEARNINFIHKYGSIEKGKKILYDSITEKIDYQAASEKRAKTNIKKYGGISPFCSEEIRAKTKQTCLERYGVDNVFKSDDVKKKIRDTNNTLYGGTGWASPELKEKYNKTMLERYGVEWGCLTQQCNQAMYSGCNSSYNKAFAAILDDNNIQYESEFILENKRYDFKINDILIEINPTATHNARWSPYGDHSGIATDYHYVKSDLALKHNFRCIHIWEWDNVEKIVQLLLPRKKLYARKCEIREVNAKEAKTFINTYHLQGSVKGDGSKNTIKLGLYYNNELVSIMTFGKPRYNTNYQYELLRFCSSYAVIGGAEKLFKYFLNKYHPKSIISYCDFSKFTGKTYEKLGFKEKSLSIGMHWHNYRTNKHITNNLLRQQGFDRLLGNIYGTFGKGTSNEYLMFEHGFLNVYDAGQRTYVYIIEDI